MLSRYIRASKIMCELNTISVNWRFMKKKTLHETFFYDELCEMWGR